MSNLDSEADRTVGDAVAPLPKPAKRWQVGVRSLILLMAVCAVWMSVLVNRREIERIDKRNQPMRPLAHELKVDDPAQFAIVRLEALWANDIRWDLYIPPGNFRLCLATREIDFMGVAKVSTSQPIASGSHQIALEVEKLDASTNFKVLCDGSKLLTFEDPETWWKNKSWRSYYYYQTSEQLAANQPLIFYRCQVDDFNELSSAVKNNPVNGLLLWIEPVGDPNASAKPVL